MPTYAAYAADRERKARKAAQDEHMRTLHARFDAQAGEHRAKSERAHFAVVGEGTRSAQEKYLAGWERTFGGHR